MTYETLIVYAAYCSMVTVKFFQSFSDFGTDKVSLVNIFIRLINDIRFDLVKMLCIAIKIFLMMGPL